MQTTSDRKRYARTGGLPHELVVCNLSRQQHQEFWKFDDGFMLQLGCQGLCQIKAVVPHILHLHVEGQLRMQSHGTSIRITQGSTVPAELY